MTALHPPEDSHVERDGERRTRSASLHTSDSRPDGVRDVHHEERRFDERSVRFFQVNAATVNGLLGILLLSLEGLLLVRFALVAFGASTRSGFVRFILDLSHPFVRPFAGAFANRSWDQGVIEPGTLLAIGVYMLLFALVMMLVRALMPQLSERHDVERRQISRE